MFSNKTTIQNNEQGRFIALQYYQNAKLVNACSSFRIVVLFEELADKSVLQFKYL